MRNQVIFKDLGRISYQKAWDYQQELLEQAIAIKRQNRPLSVTDADWKQQQHYLLFCDHPPVYTLGKSGKKEHLLLNETQLEEQGFEFFKINRGGDITYHGPGQVIAYPIFDLDEFFTDIHRYVRLLEEVVILMLAEYGIEGTRVEGYTGVWMAGTESLPKRKICAIGVHLSRWVTMHGFALNVKTDLGHFQNIVPCGINDSDKDVTSMEHELGRTIDIEEVKAKLRQHFSDLFEFDFAAAVVDKK